MDRQKIFFASGGVWELIRFSSMYLLLLSILWTEVEVTRSFLLLWFGSAQIVCAGLFFCCGFLPQFRPTAAIILILAKALSSLSGIIYILFRLGNDTFSVSPFLFSLQDPAAVLSVVLVLIDLLFLALLAAYLRGERRRSKPRVEEPERLPDFAETKVEEE
jgi:hypothetical protein